MSLLGTPLLVFLGVLAVALPVLTYLLWGRVPGAAPLRVAARAALIVSCQLSAVLLVAAAVNDYGYFYTSWAELAGEAPPGQVVAATPYLGAAGHGEGVSTTGAFPAFSRLLPPVTVLADPHWSTPAQWSSRGRLESVSIHGARSGLRGHAYVYLPPQYFRPRVSHAFPAVEVFTGYPSSDRALVWRMNYPGQLLAQLQRHRAQPMVLVMMVPSVVAPRDTECTDVPHGPQVQTYFAQDVTTAIDVTYHVRPLSWGAIGDSTGGFCATKLVMRHSDVFRSAVSLSGYYHTIMDSTTGSLWGGSRVLQMLDDPTWRITHLPAPPVSLLMTISSAEHGSLGIYDTRRFLGHVRPPMQVSTMVLARGGHNFATWSGELPASMQFLSHYLYAG